MKSEFERTAEPSTETGIEPLFSAKGRVLTLDVALYEQYLAESGLTEEQKREFLETLWTIIVGFVDLGFGIHPVQQAQDAATSE